MVNDENQARLIMNKILSAFLQENNLTHNTKEKMFYGTIGGIQVSGGISVWTSQNVLSFHARLPEDRIGEINQYLAGISKTYGIQKFSIAGDGIVCVLFTSIKKYVACAQEISNYLAGVGAKGGCPFCDEELTEGTRLVGSANGVYVAHEKCFDEYVERVKNEEAAIKAAPANLPKSLGGMALGVLAGCVVWVIFFALGFISWWAPVISGFLGAFLWDKFGGKNDKTKIICMWAISLVLLTLTLFLSYYVAILNVANDAGYTMGEALPILFADAEFKSALLQDVIISYIFIVLANAVVTVQIVQTQKLMSKSFRKL